MGETEREKKIEEGERKRQTDEREREMTRR